AEFVLDSLHVSRLLENRPGSSASGASLLTGRFRRLVLSDQLFDIGLGGMDRQTAGNDFLTDRHLPDRVADALEDLGVAGAQLTNPHGLLEFGRKFQQGYQVGDGSSAESEASGQLLVGHLVAG